MRSLGFDLERLVDEKKLAVDYVHVERSEIEETGEYDLSALFIRLGHAIDFPAHSARFLGLTMLDHFPDLFAKTIHREGLADNFHASLQK